MTKSAALAAALLAGSTALAGPVTFDYDGTARGRNVDVQIAGFYTGRVFAGNVRHDIDGVSTLGFCIDPDQFVQRGTETFETATLAEALSHRPRSAQKAAAIAELATNVGDSLFTEQADRDTAAAFQVAVWEIVSDYSDLARTTSIDLNSGSFRVSGSESVLNLAAGMLAGLSFDRGNSHGYQAYVHPDHQDYMTRMVPSPGALALAGVGLPMVAPRRRRR